MSADGSPPEPPPPIASRRSASPLDEAAIFRAIEPLLADPTTPDGDLALTAAMRMRVPEAVAAVAALAGHSSPHVRLLVAQWRARRGEDLGSLAVVAGAIGSGAGLDEALPAIQAWCASGDPALQAPAAALAARFVREHASDPADETSHRVWAALRALEDAGSSDERALLESVLTSSLARWVRGVALRRLGALEGAAGLDRQLRALADPDLRGSAARAIAAALSGPDEKAARALREALGAESHADVTGSLVEAALAAGVPQGELAPWLDRLEPWDRERLAAYAKPDVTSRST
jgi:hypothetical protein